MMQDKKSPFVIVFDSRFSSFCQVSKKELKVPKLEPDQTDSINTERFTFTYDLKREIAFSGEEDYYCRLVGGAGLNFAAFVFVDFVGAQANFRGERDCWAGLFTPLGLRSSPWLPLNSTTIPAIGFISIEPAYSSVDLSTNRTEFCLVFEIAPKSWIHASN